MDVVRYYTVAHALRLLRSVSDPDDSDLSRYPLGRQGVNGRVFGTHH